jgi:hypothetical protein
MQASEATKVALRTKKNISTSYELIELKLVRSTCKKERKSTSKGKGHG